MSYLLWKENLPVTSEIASRIDLQDYPIIVLQHAVSDTVRFLSHIQRKSWANNIHFIAKPYSAKPQRIEEIMQAGIQVSSERNYSVIEAPGYLEKILEKASRGSKLPPLVLEVWGCFARPLSQKWHNVKGVVEVTTFGHNRYLKVLPDISAPVYSIARSKIKEEEANHVGQAVATSLEILLKDLGRDLSSGQVLMIGYGMIWKSVTNAMKWRNVGTSVFDMSSFRRHEANQRGFETSPHIAELIKNADMIISSTGQQGITAEIIRNCPDWIILASAWSRQNEIDMEFLEANTSETTSIHQHMTRYIIDGKEVFVVREGKNVNFVGESCPDKCMDLIHAGVLSCVISLLDQSKPSNLWFVYELWTEGLEDIYALHEKFWHKEKETLIPSDPKWESVKPEKSDAEIGQLDLFR